MRGRKPLPTALKMLTGNPGKRPLNANEPRPVLRVPPCPKTLQGQARSEWRRITRELMSVGMISGLDLAALSIYCSAYAQWIEAQEQVKKLGAVVKSPSGFPIFNPYWSIANKAAEQMLKVASEYGLTASSRSRLHATPPAPANDESIESFMRIVND